MTIVDLAECAGRRYPAGRWTRNLVGGQSPITSEHFSLGWVVLDPGGGQVPWHEHPQEEIYLIVEGEGQICVGSEVRAVRAGQCVSIPPSTFHQLTNTGEHPMTMLYCYAPAGDVAHWRQELDGTLPRAGVDAPSLPAGAAPQRVEPA